jgi:acid phosphatase type 7
MVVLQGLFVATLVVVAVCASPSCDGSPGNALPQGVHLAFSGGNPANEIVVSWFSCGLPPETENPEVEIFGTKNASTGLLYTGKSHSYYKSWQHNVVVNGLKPGTRYFYVARLGEGVSKRFSFQTLFGAPPPLANFTTLVVGDMGVNNSAHTRARMSERIGRFNCTIHVGDISYADDSHVRPIEPSSGSSYEAVYNLFQTEMETIAASAPYMVSPGNHDVSCSAIGDLGCPKQQRNFSAFRNRFFMPSARSGAVDQRGRSVQNMWYSFDVAGIHFASISTESDFAHAPTTPRTFVGGGAGGGFGDQLTWLQADLAKAREDPSIKFVVVYGHRPWYSSVKKDWPLGAEAHVQAAFEPIFHDNRVDLYICGHKHFYERTVSAFNGKRNDANGTVQIINGAAGNNEGIEAGHGPKGLVVAANYVDEGFGTLQLLENSTVLRWQYHLASNGKVVDQLDFNTRGTNKQ